MNLSETPRRKGSTTRAATVTFALAVGDSSAFDVRRLRRDSASPVKPVDTKFNSSSTAMRSFLNSSQRLCLPMLGQEQSKSLRRGIEIVRRDCRGAEG